MTNKVSDFAEEVGSCKRRKAPTKPSSLTTFSHPVKSVRRRPAISRNTLDHSAMRMSLHQLTIIKSIYAMADGIAETVM